jgi:hypothetical protein
MSTDYETTKLIYEADLFDGRLAKHGVREHFPAPGVIHGGDRCLTDGQGGFLWVHCGDNVGVGGRLHFTRYASNMMNGSVADIIDAIEKEFDTIIFAYSGDDIPDDLNAQIEPTRKKPGEKIENISTGVYIESEKLQTIVSELVAAKFNFKVSKSHNALKPGFDIDKHPLNDEWLREYYLVEIDHRHAPEREQEVEALLDRLGVTAKRHKGIDVIETEDA